MLENFEVDLPQFEISELPGSSTEGFNCIAQSISNYEKWSRRWSFSDESRHQYDDVSPSEIARWQNFSKGGPIKRLAQGRQNPKAGPECDHYMMNTCWFEMTYYMAYLPHIIKLLVSIIVISIIIQCIHNYLLKYMCSSNFTWYFKVRLSDMVSEILFQVEWETKLEYNRRSIIIIVFFYKYY